VKITPLEVDQAQFARVFRGCDPEEVQRFLDMVSREMEELIRESNVLKEEIRRRDQQITEYRSAEAQLREAMVSAGRMTDEIRDAAKKESELIVAEAELRAEKIISAAQERAVRLSEETRDLKRTKARLIAEVRAILQSHERLLDTQEEIDRELDREAQATQQALRKRAPSLRRAED
jgi:cell division initiation protein